MSELLVDEEVETSLVIAAINDRSVFDGGGLPRPSDFKNSRLGAVWGACEALRRAALDVDLDTLTESLRTKGELERAGGVPFLTELAFAPPLTGNAPVWARRISDLAQRRALVARAKEAISRAGDFSRSAGELALEASGALAAVGAQGDGQLRTLRTDVEELIDELDDIAGGKAVGVVKTGIELYDEVLGGLQRRYLNGIGAQPSVGKSALMGRMIANIASRGEKVGLFSLEDRAIWLPRRLTAKASGVPVRTLSTTRLNEHQSDAVGHALSGIHGWADNIFIEQRSRLSPLQVASVARQMIAAGAVAVFVDHMGEVALELGRSERHDLALGEGLAHLRDVAKETGAPVVPLFHFARPMRSNTEPRFTRPTSTSWANAAGIERMLRVGVGLWLNPPPEPEDTPEVHRNYDPNDVVVTVLKQTDGDKDIDFTLKLHKPSGLIESRGGRVRKGTTGHHEDSQ